MIFGNLLKSPLHCQDWSTNILISSYKSQNFEVQSQNGETKSKIVRQKATL